MAKVQTVAGTGQTVGATTAVLASIMLESGDKGHVTVKAVGRSAAGDVISGHREVSAKETAGAAALVGTVLNTAMPTPDAAVAAAVIDVVVSGFEVRLRVTGVAGLTLDWRGQIEMAAHGPASASASPPVGPGMTLLEYWVPDDIMGTTSVTSWDGATGAHDLVPGTAPGRNSNWPGSKLQVEFVRGSNHQLVTDVTSTAKSYTIAELAKPVLNANWNTMWSAPDFNNFAAYLFDSGNNATVYYNGGASGLAGVPMTDSVQTLIRVFDATANTWELFRDGVSLGTAAYADTDLLTQLRLGSQAPSGAEPMSCALRAAVIYEGVADAATVALLHTWLNSFA